MNFFPYCRLFTFKALWESRHRHLGIGIGIGIQMQTLSVTQFYILYTIYYIYYIQLVLYTIYSKQVIFSKAITSCMKGIRVIPCRKTPKKKCFLRNF